MIFFLAIHKQTNGTHLSFGARWRITTAYRSAILLLVGLNLWTAAGASAGEQSFVLGPLVTRVDAESAVVIWVGPPTEKPGHVSFERASGGEARIVAAAIKSPPFADRRADQGVTGDTHDGHATIAEAVAAARPHFVVHAGDFVGGRGHEWGNWR